MIMEESEQEEEQEQEQEEEILIDTGEENLVYINSKGKHITVDIDSEIPMVSAPDSTTGSINIIKSTV